jgi:hypothetical protein
MPVTERITRLRELQQEADSIRTELGVSPPGRILYLAAPNVLSNEIIVVEADGFGGATTRVAEGHFPVDYYAKYERVLETERAAEEAAEQIVDEKRSPAIVLVDGEEPVS